MFFVLLTQHTQKQYIFLAFFALFEAGSCICGFAPTSHTFIAGRAVSGLGAAGIVNGAYTIVAAAVPMEKRPGENKYVTWWLMSIADVRDGADGIIMMGTSTAFLFFFFF